jgi:hypothetical protein
MVQTGRLKKAREALGARFRDDAFFITIYRLAYIYIAAINT